MEAAGARWVVQLPCFTRMAHSAPSTSSEGCRGPHPASNRTAVIRTAHRCDPCHKCVPVCAGIHQGQAWQGLCISPGPRQHTRDPFSTALCVPETAGPVQHAYLFIFIAHSCYGCHDFEIRRETLSHEGHHHAAMTESRLYLTLHTEGIVRSATC